MRSPFFLAVLPRPFYPLRRSFFHRALDGDNCTHASRPRVSVNSIDHKMIMSDTTDLSVLRQFLARPVPPRGRLARPQH